MSATTKTYNPLHYASEVAVRGARLDLDGIPWRGAETRCACCAKPILPGDIAVRDKDRFGQSFMDGPSLAAKGSGAVCGACSAIMNAKPLMALQHVVVTTEGAYPIRRDAHRSWFLLSPPKPPWVAVVSDTKLAHLIWRTPVTLDNNLMIVRLGGRIMRIRRPALQKAIEDCQVCADAYNDACDDLAAAKKKKKSERIPDLKHPFVSLGREFDNNRQALVRSVLTNSERSRQGTAVADALERLRRLTQGEIWALATLVKRNPDIPEQPESIDLSPNALRLLAEAKARAKAEEEADEAEAA